jgi:hypothetical protein
MTCNCIVVLIFAAFFIEANLPHIIKEMGVYKKMNKFLNGRNPGLYPSFCRFCNGYVKGKKLIDKDDFLAPEFRRELYNYFEGLEEIHSFRNDVAHGTITKSLTNREEASRVRGNAKDIVKHLFKIAEK